MGPTGRGRRPRGHGDTGQRVPSFGLPRRIEFAAGLARAALRRCGSGLRGGRWCRTRLVKISGVEAHVLGARSLWRAVGDTADRVDHARRQSGSASAWRLGGPAGLALGRGGRAPGCRGRSLAWTGPAVRGERLPRPARLYETRRDEAVGLACSRRALLVWVVGHCRFGQGSGCLGGARCWAGGWCGDNGAVGCGWPAGSGLVCRLGRWLGWCCVVVAAGWCSVLLAWCSRARSAANATFEKSR